MRSFAPLSFLVLLLLGLLGACDESARQSTQSTSLANPAATAAVAEDQRWYSQAQVETGTVIFSDNCAICHGVQAQGLTENWRQRLPDGNFPAPPLNGSAHAWHHPLSQLLQTVTAGGVPYGGQMPPFGEALSDDDKLAAIAYFQSFWDEEIYLGWLDLGGLD